MERISFKLFITNISQQKFQFHLFMSFNNNKNKIQIHKQMTRINVTVLINCVSMLINCFIMLSIKLCYQLFHGPVVVSSALAPKIIGSNTVASAPVGYQENHFSQHICHLNHKKPCRFLLQFILCATKKSKYQVARTYKDGEIVINERVTT